MNFSTPSPLIFALIASLLYISETPQSTTHTPERNSIERKQILDALRSPVESKLKKTVVFKVDHLKASGDWAFMRGVPQQPGGKRMDYEGTSYEGAIKDGAFDDWICALLRKEKNKWRVVVFVIGATDVAYEGWDKEFNAPSDIFK
jgi:hypothetical protein